MNGDEEIARIDWPQGTSVDPYVHMLQAKLAEFGEFEPLDAVDLFNIVITIVGDWHLCLNVAQRHGLSKDSRMALWEWLEYRLSEL